MKEPRDSFWSDVATLRGAVTLRIVPHVAIFGALSVVCLQAHSRWPAFALEVGPVEILGGALGVLLVLRTNAGYDRWWEARKAWGAIANDTRALITAAAAYSTATPGWHTELRNWVAVLPQVALRHLRGLPCDELIEPLAGQAAAANKSPATHWVSFVSQRIAHLLDRAQRQDELSEASLINLERTRVQLLHHIGACERIVSTPLPRVYVIKIRRFVAIYLLALPLALVDRVGMATPLLTMLVAYTVLGVDRIAHELQNPFARNHLSNLPLDAICQKLAEEVLAGQ